jgi:hypothetical protein
VGGKKNIVKKLLKIIEFWRFEYIFRPHVDTKVSKPVDIFKTNNVIFMIKYVCWTAFLRYPLFALFTRCSKAFLPDMSMHLTAFLTLYIVSCIVPVLKNVSVLN